MGDDTLNTAAGTDGRVERTAVTRRRILDATRGLLLDGVAEPTAREIAAAANITTRTLFRHFGDMDALYLGLGQDTERRAMGILDEPFAAELAAQADWRELLDVVIDRRVRLYESLLPVYVSSLWGKYLAASSKQARQVDLRRGRRRLREILPAGLIADEVHFEALVATLSIAFWSSLRRDQGLSVDQATQVLRCAVARMTAEIEHSSREKHDD